MGHGLERSPRIRYDESAPGAPLSRGAFLRIARYFQPYRREAVWITLCILAISLLGLVPPLLVRDVIDHAIPGRNVGALVRLVGLMIAVPAVAGLIGVLQNWFAVRVGQAVMYDIRNEMYEKLLFQSLRFYTNTKSGEILDFSDDGGRRYRWWFNALHRWDFSWLLQYKPLWYTLVWTFALMGLVLSVTSVVIGWRRVRRKIGV
jgi:ABC-type multidrug transport system fused ATPase/permease subunit